jgi:hypothetical protein
VENTSMVCTVDAVSKHAIGVTDNALSYSTRPTKAGKHRNAVKPVCYLQYNRGGFMDKNDPEFSGHFALASALTSDGRALCKAPACGR